MGFIDRLRSMFGSGEHVTHGWQDIDALFAHHLGADAILQKSPPEMWRDQPHLRTVVNFLARNVAQLGLHTYERVNESDRVRVRDSPLVKLLKRPNTNTTAYELIYGIVADLALFDRAYLYVGENLDAPSGWEIFRLPVPWVTPRKGDAFGYKAFRVNAPGAQQYVDLGDEDILMFHGWSPISDRDGSSPVEALKHILAEQMEAVRYREAVWRRGGKVSSVITRPGGHRWTDDQRKAFREDWNSKFTGSGSSIGGTPILEDGMTLNKVDFSATEQEFVEGAKLALTTIASVYHVNPTMIGLLDNANYSNVREFRKMLYGDTLGPLIAQLEDRLNTFLVDRIDDREGLYVEFNIQEKLQGNFEEQTAALQKAVGRPWMLANEARALLNMPALEGDADELVTPLNVLIGGQASPGDGVTEGQGGGDVDDLEPDVEDEPKINGTVLRGPHLHIEKRKAL